MLACKANISCVYVTLVCNLKSVKAQDALVAGDAGVLLGLQAVLLLKCWDMSFSLDEAQSSNMNQKGDKVFLNTYMASPPVTPTPFLDRMFNLVACLT